MTKTKNPRNPGAKKGNVTASCGGSGCYISVRVLPYGHRQRRSRHRINRHVKATVNA